MRRSRRGTGATMGLVLLSMAASCNSALGPFSGGGDDDDGGEMIDAAVPSIDGSPSTDGGSPEQPRIDAMFYRDDPGEHVLGFVVGTTLYRYDFDTSDWRAPVDLSVEWSGDANAPFTSSSDPIDAMLSRNDPEALIHRIGVWRGGTHYVFDLETNTWNPVADLEVVQDGDPNAPFYDSSVAIDAAMVRRDPTAALHRISFVRGTIQYRFDLDAEAWMTPIDRSTDWAEPGGPFEDDVGPIDAMFFRDDADASMRFISWVRGSNQYRFDLDAEAWMTPIDRGSAEGPYGVEDPALDWYSGPNKPLWTGGP